MSKQVKLAAFDLGFVMVDVREEIPIRRLAELSGKPEELVFETIFSTEKKALYESGKISWEQQAANAIKELDLPIDEPELRWIFRMSLIRDETVVGMVSEVAEKTRIAIASNTSQPHWEWAQDNLPFADRFDPPILSHLVGAMKPDAAFYRALIERSGLKPDEIFFTDDRQDNIEGAEAVGIRAFQFTGPEQLRADLASVGIEVQVP